MSQNKLVHGGLLGGECLLHKKWFGFLEAAQQSGQFPDLHSDDGLIPALCFLGMYLPLNTYHANLTGIPRKMLLKTQGLDRLKAIRYIFFVMHGFSPVLEFHMPKAKDRLTVEKLKTDYLLAAEILSKNPQVKGTYGATWYFDPHIRMLSPLLGAIQDLSMVTGAIAVCLGTDGNAVADALRKNPKRRAAYERGEYSPRRFARLWARGRALEWAHTEKTNKIC
jgi:hypothetical protein